MSGGHFDYLQYRMRQIADSIEDIIVKNKVEIENAHHSRFDYDENGNLYDWAKYYYFYDDDIIEKMKEGYWKLREAEIYAQRVDWLVSGDDGDDSFRNRLKQDLEELENEKKTKSWTYTPKDEEDY